MTIETKFGINDDVWFINSQQKAFCSRVINIRIEVSSKPIHKAGKKRDLIKTVEYQCTGTNILYTFDNPSYTPSSQKTVSKFEHNLFSTKEELLKSLA